MESQSRSACKGQGCSRGLRTSYPFREGPTKTTGRIEGTTSYGEVCSVCRERRGLQMFKRWRELQHFKYKLTALSQLCHMSLARFFFFFFLSLPLFLNKPSPRRVGFFPSRIEVTARSMVFLLSSRNAPDVFVSS